ncbi:hypothetical protein GJAV_G00088470 [Gymnothorax javanicus]|nr:hypothetical protein GJAV_G00088470 [Gymnothorax javanicus]
MSGCCVFGCQNRYSTGGLKFYWIPTGSRPFQRNRRRLWLQAIKRTDWTEDTIKNARACSAHFISGEASLDSSCPDFVPSVFVSSKQSQKPEAKMERYHRKRERDDMVNNPPNQRRPSETPDQECSMDHCPAEQPATDHNYARDCVGDAAAAETIRQLEAKIRSLESQPGDMSFTLLINRYCATDEEFRFYTQFPSETVFWEFWESVVPSASRLAYWSRAQRASDAMALEKPSPNRRLALVDELFSTAVELPLA